MKNVLLTVLLFSGVASAGETLPAEKPVVECADLNNADGPRVTYALTRQADDTYKLYIDSTTMRIDGKITVVKRQVDGLACSLHAGVSKDQNSVVFKKALCDQERADASGVRREISIIPGEEGSEGFNIYETKVIPAPSTGGLEMGVMPTRKGRVLSFDTECRLLLPVK